MVADNTGARRVECIKVLGGSKEDTLLLEFNSYQCKGRNTKGKS